MELITAKTLWKDYDPRNIPLDETVLITEYNEKYSVKHVYFNGEATGDGCTRIYARVHSFGRSGCAYERYRNAFRHHLYRNAA